MRIRSQNPDFRRLSFPSGAVIFLSVALTGFVEAGQPEETIRLASPIPLLSLENPNKIVELARPNLRLKIIQFDTGRAAYRVFVEEEQQSYLVDPAALGRVPEVPYSTEVDVTIRVPGSMDASYVLHLPADYLASRPPPIVFAFPPFGDGKDFIQYLKEPCSRLGWILIGCNGLKNGRNEVFYPTARDILRDVRRRIPHDRRREYLLGFSGGAMGSYRLSRGFWDEFAGVVAFGGWLGVYDEKLVYPERLVVAMLNGNRDSGAREVEKKDRKILKRFRIRTELFRFSGGHEIPPGRVIEEALRWVDSQWDDQLREHPRLDLSSEELDKRLLGAWARFQGQDYSGSLGHCLDLVLNHSFSWQAEAAEQILTRVILDERSRPLSAGQLEIIGARTASVLFAKARASSQTLPRTSYSLLEISHALRPDDAEITARLAHDQLVSQDPEIRDVFRARQLAEEASELDRKYWLAWYVQGLAAAGTNPVQSREHLQRALELAPNWAQVICREKLSQFETLNRTDKK